MEAIPVGADEPGLVYVNIRIYNTSSLRKYATPDNSDGHSG